MRLVHSGKVKDIYEIDDNRLLFQFSDRISAFDVPMATPIRGKGKILCKFAEFWFNYLEFKNHMIKIENDNKMIVKKLQMIPVESVVRGYLYGSLYERYKNGMFPNPTSKLVSDHYTNLQLASKLHTPLFDPATKSQEHDMPLSEEQILEQKILNENDLKIIKNVSINLYCQMTDLAEKAGFIIADVKFEFGRDPCTGEIILGDSIGPDEFRLWENISYQVGKKQESFDKQYLRDWLIDEGFKERVDRFAAERTKPEPPSLPIEIVNEIYHRYHHAFSVLSSANSDFICNSSSEYEK